MMRLVVVFCSTPTPMGVGTPYKVMHEMPAVHAIPYALVEHPREE